MQKLTLSFQSLRAKIELRKRNKNDKNTFKERKRTEKTE